MALPAGMTMAEKILTRASGKPRVSPGEFVTAKVDLVMANDAVFPGACKALEDAGLKKVFDADKIVVVIDHWVPANTPMIAFETASLRRKDRSCPCLIYPRAFTSRKKAHARASSSRKARYRRRVRSSSSTRCRKPA